MAEPGPAGSLGALGLARDPIGDPLVYPGRPPAESGLLAGDRFLALREEPGAPPGSRRLPGGETLDDALRDAGGSRFADRHPVLAVGSNGSPAQVHRKLAGRAPILVPMTYAEVTGLVPGVSAHVSRPGYVPAAPVLVPGATARLIVLWLDDDQLAVVDATEPNYHRLRTPAAVRVSLDGVPVGCGLYAGRHGCLTDREGRPFRLTSQAALLTVLLADLPGLGRLAGTRDSAEFAARVRSDPALREEIRLLWRRENRVLRQSELTPDGPCL
ncbi:hypothetical protein [Actinoallomurus iriomotensis]|uniref:Uncharacterized protein n=1 Tax=Actinoallomurus iriomotensis TaxID=478107 RepID=A0A9W6RJ21_9ACTN|nr:hypothetical protein [Actinoallomurus iriomotensis]GLY76439.1 hypothetical protein Airi01_047060 [Actinoallomurus iriomotensis]